MKTHTQIAFAVVTGLGLALTVVAQEHDVALNPAVIEVNGENIYAAEITMTMQNIVAQLGGREKVKDKQELVQIATQRMVEEKLLAQEARRKGIQANELRLAQMVNAIEKQAGGRHELETNVAKFGSSYDQVVGMLREMELARSLIEKEIIPTIQVSTEEIAAFYAENPNLFESEEQVRARHILITATANDSESAVAEARAKAEDARKRVLAGEDFGAVARDVSQDPSAANGGELGFFTRKSTDPQFAAAAFALEPGGISEIVQTPYGFHIINVEEKRPAGRLSLEDVSDQVRTVLIQKKTGESVGRLIESLADTATIRNLVDSSAPSAATPQ
jgi:peptidyl-prolyl cis-trans isomerase C